MSGTSQQPPRPASPVAVLVVDDDDDVRDSLCDLLRLTGYIVYAAPDGMSALDRLRTHPSPMIVLLDWMMPGMDGLQVLHALAEDAAAVQPHVFFVLTASKDELTWRLGQHEVAVPSHLSVAVLGKPFDMDDLLEFVARAAAHLVVDR